MARFFGILLLLNGALQIDVKSQNIDKLEKLAERNFYAENFDLALQDYNKVLSLKADHKLAMYRVEICSLLTDYRTNPIENLLSYQSTQGKKDKFYNYWLGRAYFSQNQFKMAIASWQQFLDLKKYKSKEIIAETKVFLKWAQDAEQQFSHPENYEIDQLSSTINTSATEYSPVYFKEKNELIFLSAVASSEEEEQFQIYHSLQKNGQWSDPEPIIKFGFFTADNANIEVVNNDGKLFLYRGEHKGYLYYSELLNGKWRSLLKFDADISPTKLESHFFINEKETRILFAHRTHGRKGDLDIYESVKLPSSGKWSKPKLFSENISSGDDEDFPFLTADEKTLYFSSRGFETIGGYDIYRSDFDEATNTWSKPISLRYPANTPDDDIQFKIDQETNSGYFVSNRFGTIGSFDIYFFHHSVKVLMAGIVTDGSGEPADHARIEFLPGRETGLAIKTMTDESGRYKVKVGENDQLTVNIYFHNELVHTEKVKTPQIAAVGASVEVTKNFEISKLKQEIVQKTEHQDDPKHTDLRNIGSKFRVSNKTLIRNIYFRFEQYYLLADDKPKLDPLVTSMRENPNVKIEIAGHTDNIGDGRMNLRISQLRARSVAKYLVDSGISKNRLVAKGYGDALPIASNDQEKEGRELNRRIEIVVLE